ncbi:MAG: hypothetical protein M1484_01745 [Patescibacteria group bacterium]|nr:hypothetical protein [Patescibacteria group bacterium]MCL5431803.1 hypothetical protein [Patescibacteria group bacterium]
MSKELAPIITKAVKPGAIATFTYLMHFSAYPLVAKAFPAATESIRDFALNLPINPSWTFETLKNLGMRPETAGLIVAASLILPVIPLSLMIIAATVNSSNH